MHTEQTANEFIIRETPGCLWIFGLFFAFIGGVFVYGALGGLADFASQPWWTLALAFLLGACGVCAGVWIIYNAPLTKIVIDRLENTVLIARFGLFARRETVYDFDDVERFCLVEEKDDEDASVWYFALKLADDETIKITSLASHSEEYERQYVFHANVFMGKQLPATCMIINAEDEGEAEMS